MLDTVGWEKGFRRGEVQSSLREWSRMMEAGIRERNLDAGRTNFELQFPEIELATLGKLLTTFFFYKMGIIIHAL